MDPYGNKEDSEEPMFDVASGLPFAAASFEVSKAGGFGGLA